MHRFNGSRHRLPVRLALCTALILLACGQDGDEYAPLGNDREMRATVVAGDVRDPGSLAVSDALVVIEPATNGIPASADFLSKNPGAARTSTPGRRVTTTDARGRFAFDDVATGNYFVQVIADDHLGAMQSIQVPITFVDTVYVDVNLTPTGTFSGVSELENAANHQGTIVYVEGTSYVAVTDQAGNYAITNVPVGSYTVRADHAHYLADSENGTLTTAGENVVLANMLLKLDSNIPPIASIASASPQIANIDVNFAASGSDADGTVVLYEWDWEDDGTFDYSSPTTANTTHVYAVAGAYTAKLRVTDDSGAIGLAAIQLNIMANDPNRVYMATSGSDANDGSIVAPVATLTKAYQVAQLQGKTEILIEAGSYGGPAPAFLAGISILGGRTLPSWNESPSGSSQFTFAASRATANNIAVSTLLRRVALLMTLPGGGQNSIALYALNSNSNLRFEECTFNVANGINGQGGVNGPDGANGSTGNPGFPGSCDGGHGNGGSGGTGACPGGNGGAGGPEVGPNNGQPGGIGACSGGGGGAGGLGQTSGGLTCTAVGQPGGNGINGAAGNAGANGVSGSPAGAVVGNEWVPATSTNGGNGENGRGGGGGGGGGGQQGFSCNDGGGNGGGGGGGGGAGGTGGGGGQGGRASFCVMLVNSSPSFTACTFQRGVGGTGGAGGAAGNGGAGAGGGAGAAQCTGEVGRGGNGGAGGNGGIGGGGAGGPGGPSYGIYKAGTSTPTLIGNVFIGGGAGVGGNGGGAAPNGTAGLFGTTN